MCLWILCCNQCLVEENENVVVKMNLLAVGLIFRTYVCHSFLLELDNFNLSCAGRVSNIYKIQILLFLGTFMCFSLILPFPLRSQLQLWQTTTIYTEFVHGQHIFFIQESSGEGLFLCPFLILDTLLNLLSAISVFWTAYSISF